MGDEVPGADDGLPPGPAGTPAAGSRVAGYRLQEQIGQGGMAVVFRAEDEAYADMTVTAPGSPVPQQNFSTGLVP